MMDVTLTQLETSTELHAEASTGNKQWVAVITDTHPKYNYDREFVAYQKPKTSDRDSGRAEITEGDVIEKVRYTHSGKNDTRRYYQLAAGELHEIDETEITQALEDVIVDVGPDEEIVDELTQADDELNEPATADGGEPAVVADGGLEVRDRSAIRNTDAEVRTYSADGTLYAYRSDDGDHHIVVSRGRESPDRWEKRVPATVDRPVPGQQLWAIPDNWEHRVSSRRDSIAYGLFYVPESEVWARVSIPTNNHLTDAWYGVSAVGDLTVDPVGTLGTATDVRQFADEYEQDHDAPEAAADAEAFREIARNWDAVESDLEHTLEWVRDEGLAQKRTGDQPVPADDQFQIEYHQDRVFRAGEAIERAADLSDYEIPTSVVLEELRGAGLLPDYYTFELSIDDSSVGMEHSTRGLIEAGCTPPETLDYYMVEIKGLSQSGWADERGVSQPSVSDRVNDAKRNLGA